MVDGAPGDASDRTLPPRTDRPPASRLMSPRGAALRLYLTALFEAQASTSRAGTHPVNKRRLSGPGEQPSWADLLASPAQLSRVGSAVHMTPSAKKMRQLKTTLVRLHEEELITLPHSAAGAGKYEGFELMHEAGKRRQGANDLYKLPKPTDKDFFVVPTTLFTQGWIHCLEDTELAFLLMLASMNAYEQPAAVMGEVRLLHYGIGRDAYEAHMMLNNLGLVQVTIDPRRFDDGKIEGYNDHHEAFLHRFQLLPAGLDTPAFVAVRDQVAHGLEHGSNA